MVHEEPIINNTNENNIEIIENNVEIIKPQVEEKKITDYNLFLTYRLNELNNAQA